MWQILQAQAAEDRFTTKPSCQQSFSQGGPLLRAFSLRLVAVAFPRLLSFGRPPLLLPPSLSLSLSPVGVRWAVATFALLVARPLVLISGGVPSLSSCGGLPSLRSFRWWPSSLFLLWSWGGGLLTFLPSPWGCGCLPSLSC